MKVSETILDQLGGNKFLTITGAKNLATNGQNLSFKLPKALKNKINCVKIELQANDLYEVTLIQINPRKFIFNVVERINDVAITELQNVFEDRTGYLTRI